MSVCNALVRRRASLDDDRRAALAMSERRATSDRVRNEQSITIDRVSEDGARLHGLMAMLVLPARRGADGIYRRPIVEVEIAPDCWAPVESVIIDADGMTLSWGSNGSAIEYKFPGTTCPRWRMV